MKKLLFTCLTALAASVTVSAQLTTYMLDDFENGHVNFTSVVNVNPSDNMDTAVVANPASDAVNSTMKCWKWKRLDVGVANQPWAGFWSVLTTPIVAGCQTITIKFYRTNAKSLLKIHCESTGSVEFLPKTAPTKVNEWEELTFDVAAHWTKSITVFGFQPDYPADGSTIDIGASMYIDEIKVTTGTPPPPPTSIIFFDDSTDGTDNTYHDGSYIGVTSPSTVLQPAASPNKFPVVTSPVESGTNALELQWKSLSSGDWMAMVGMNNWGISDISTLTQLHFWVNSAEGLSKANMPNIYFEAAAGSPNHTGKVLMSTYLTSDLVANTWTKVTIPLADIWAADPTFNSQSSIHGIFFSQMATDGTLHTLYLDNFVFDKITTGLFNPKIENKLNAYYMNGEILIPNFTGNVQVYDFTGRTIFEGITSEGKISVNMIKGIYIVKTAIGNTKISVR